MPSKTLHSVAFIRGQSDMNINRTKQSTTYYKIRKLSQLSPVVMPYQHGLQTQNLPSSIQ